MGRARGIAIVGVIALIAVPALALGDSVKKPVAGARAPYGAHSSLSDRLEKPAQGAWVPYGGQDFEQSDVAFANFTVAGAGVTSLTFAVTSDSGENPGCPTGSVSVSSSLGLKRYKFARSRPFWAFGRVVRNKHFPRGEFEDAPVTATLDGQPIKGAALSVQFVAADTEGLAGDSSGGTFDFTAKCGVTLSEDINQSENSGSS
jgi:hypothetical protein